MAAETTGRLRWAVNSTEWEPVGEHEGAEFKYLLGLIHETGDRESVLRFMRFQDKKRALLSRLLVRRASALALGLSSFRDLEIARTKGKKPFLLRPRPGPERAELVNFNFSVSHEGDWVVLASEPVCVCGVDVAAPQERRGGVNRRSDIFRDLEDQLTSTEWDFVRREGQRPPAGPDDDPAYEAFQRHWSCKEAFVKARGDGLGFPFNQVEFSLQPAAELDAEQAAGGAAPPGFCARVDGRETLRWRFFQERLGSNHWVAVARGPTTDIVDANGEFRQTLCRRTESFTEQEWREELEVEEPPIQIVDVGFLVPADAAEGYARVAASGAGGPGSGAAQADDTAPGSAGG